MTLDELKTWEYVIPGKVLAHILDDKGMTTATKYVGWLQKVGEDVVYRVWAYRTTKKYGQQYRETMRSILGEPQLIYRDMYLCWAGGYKVVYTKSSGHSQSWYGYSYYRYSEEDFGRWYNENKIGVSVNILNLDMLKDTKFKYSGYHAGSDLLEWMRTYIQYPQVEFLGKLGFPPSKKLLKKAAKDKAFCKYLSRVNPESNINAVCYAYDHNMSIYDAGVLLMHKQEAGKNFKGNVWLKRAKINIVKASKYVERVGCNPQSYCDYIEACYGLKLDLTDTKNIYPDEFYRMHTLRVNQWDAKKNRQQYNEFKKAAVNYVKYEFAGDIYSIVIPKKLSDLKNEGAALGHCVGKMGYDSKMIKGQSFIAFVRNNDSIKEPFVTVEVELPSKRVLQCYGIHDSTPDKSVRDFVKDWSKKIKKVV